MYQNHFVNNSYLQMIAFYLFKFYVAPFFFVFFFESELKYNYVERGL